MVCFLRMCKLGLLPKVVRHGFHHPSVCSKVPVWVGLSGLSLLLFNFNCPGDSFTDSLANGYSSNYRMLYTNTSLFAVATNGGDLLFSKPVGEVNSNFQYATLASLLVARGDFSAQVDFTNASLALVNGSIGNQVQLNTSFGGQDFLVVRGDEVSAGQNAHVYLNSPEPSMGTIGWTTNFGTLRVVRSGTLVQGYIDSTLLYQNNYNTNDTTFTFVLQNNHTSDAISAGFANFQLTADDIVPLPRQLSVQLSGPRSLVVTWEDTSWPNLLSGYTLFSSTNLAGPNPWQVLVTDPAPTGNQFLITNAISSAPMFFRFQQGP
jgi:hypothetical protein